MSQPQPTTTPTLVVADAPTSAVTTWTTAAQQIAVSDNEAANVS